MFETGPVLTLYLSVFLYGALVAVVGFLFVAFGYGRWEDWRKKGDKSALFAWVLLMLITLVPFWMWVLGK